MRARVGAGARISSCGRAPIRKQRSLATRSSFANVPGCQRRAHGRKPVRVERLQGFVRFASQRGELRRPHAARQHRGPPAASECHSRGRRASRRVRRSDGSPPKNTASARHGVRRVHRETALPARPTTTAPIRAAFPRALARVLNVRTVKPHFDFRPEPTQFTGVAPGQRRADVRTEHSRGIDAWHAGRGQATQEERAFAGIVEQVLRAKHARKFLAPALTF